MNIAKVYPSGSVEMITPEIALKYLAMNGENPRRLNKRSVQQYAIDMATGNWVLNGESIVFDSNGNLKNGQHRLNAVVQANVTVPMMVVRGVDPSVTSFDYGLRRRLNQEMNVTTNVESIASIVVTNCYSLANIPKGLQKAYINDHLNDLKTAESIAWTGQNHPKSKKRDIMSAIYLLWRKGEDEEQLRDFFSVVNSGFMLDDRESSSAIVLGKYIDGLSSIKHRDKIFKNMECVRLAFNDFVKGVRRRNQYIINDTSRMRALLDEVREKDGLTF